MATAPITGADLSQLVAAILSQNQILTKILAQLTAGVAILPGGITAGAITQHQTGQLYQMNGATIDRLADRVLVGDAVQGSGNFPSNDWLSLAISQSDDTAQFVSLAQEGNPAIVGGVRSSTAPPAILDNYAVAAFGLNDNTSGQLNVVTTIYNETHHWAAANQSLAQESDLIPLSGATLGDIDPYNMFNNLVTANMWLSVGKPGVSTSPGTVALAIENNTQKVKVGLVIDDTVVLQDSRIANFADAICLSTSHAIVWFTSAGTIGRVEVCGTGNPTMTLPNSSVYWQLDGGNGQRQWVSAGGGTWRNVTSS